MFKYYSPKNIDHVICNRVIVILFFFFIDSSLFYRSIDDHNNYTR